MRKLTIHLLAMLLVALPLLGVFANDTSAASSRVAVIKEMKGTVKVKKSGGSKEFTAFAKMSLNEGDVLAVGAGGSAVLQFSNGTSEDDKMTVSSNTTLTFSKLSNSKGTTTKVSMFNGSAWVDVKSITNKDDEFNLETPTAVMGVRGTHLLVSVDPVSGATRLTVAAGVVTTKSTTPGDEPKNVLPTQYALATKDDKGNSDITIAQVDLELLMKQSDRNIISAIVQATLDIEAENITKSKEYENIDQKASDENYKKNVSNIVGALITQALESKVIDQQRLNELVAQVKAATGVDIDISKKTLTLTDEEKALQEKQKQKDKEALDQAKKQKEDEKNKRDKELQDKLDAARKKKEEENRKALEEKNKKAEEEYKKALSDEQRKKYEEDKKKIENTPTQPTQPTQSTSQTSSTGSSSGSLSSNANLSSLTLKALPQESGSPIDVNLAHPTTNLYTANVAQNVAFVKVTPTVEESHATVKVNGTIVSSGSSSMSLPLGDAGTTTTINVVVTAENGTIKQYTIVVTREFYGVKYNDVKQNSKIMEFDRTNPNPELTVPINNFYIEISPKLADDLNISSIIANDTSISLDISTGFYLIPLDLEENYIDIDTIASSGPTLTNNSIVLTEGSHYHLVVTRESAPYGITYWSTTGYKIENAEFSQNLGWDPIAPNVFTSTVGDDLNIDSIYVKLNVIDDVDSVEISYNAATESKTVLLSSNNVFDFIGTVDDLPHDKIVVFELTMKNQDETVGMPQTFILLNGVIDEITESSFLLSDESGNTVPYELSDDNTEMKYFLAKVEADISKITIEKSADGLYVPTLATYANGGAEPVYAIDGKIHVPLQKGINLIFVNMSNGQLAVPILIYRDIVSDEIAKIDSTITNCVEGESEPTTETFPLYWLFVSNTPDNIDTYVPIPLNYNSDSSSKITIAVTHTSQEVTLSVEDQYFLVGEDIEGGIKYTFSFDDLFDEITEGYGSSIPLILKIGDVERRFLILNDYGPA
ncbi:cadherin-like beta sandwich domain-containing protein [Cohnella silvisoli]|uniref:Cadherin-like beta sandwich domain-containing protein n=1 Tax=Cohnella silvisoli TaxID=2873699 RepID=A0ABV1KPD1_9BACL|nr:cadherin-like beta sandwich domain-containing protein [Cohnella silvisoli]MCD9025622.1 cadherin-like beta sandwich domain-containing protein [Cohnella silvisoli]